MNIYFSQKTLIALSLLVASFYFSQNKAETALKKFEENYPQEKIHLLLNKKNYVAGENLWFTSFVFDGYNPSTISTNVFVELYDQNKKQISKKIYPLIQGKGSGSITLPANLKEDVYYIRAYTTWMGNFSDHFNEILPIIVYNPSSPEKLVKNTTSSWTAQVFPESGTFIDGINTKFAVRLQSKGETPSIWNGYVTEIQNLENKIVSFKGFDQNVGSFSFIPSMGKKYLLIVEDDKGIKQTVNLPDVLSSGIHLELENTNNDIKLRFNYKNTPQNSKYKVLGTINNKLVFETNITSSDNKVYAIPKDKTINGVLNFTVFDEDENIVLERLCFIDSQMKNLKNISLKDISLDNKSKATNSLSFQNPVISNYFITVIDANSESSENNNSLISTIYLTGDIKSKIYQPAQYFDHKQNNEALDALLISEKWKRFSWQSILADKFPIISHQPTNYLSYKGKAVKLGQPLVNEEINILFKSKDKDFNLIKTDNNGFFKLENLFFEDKMEISYQINKSKTEKNSIQLYIQPEFSFLPLRQQLENNTYQLVTRESGEKPSTNLKQAISTYQSEKFLKEKITEIEEVKIVAKKRSLTQKLNDELSSSMFKGTSEMVFDFVNENNMISNSGNILQWLQGRAPGVTFQLGGADPKIMYRGGQIPLFVDEFQVQVSDAGNISPSDVAMIKFIRNDFRGTSGGGSGAILIYTRRGNMPGNAVDSSKPSSRNEINLSGYDTEETFTNDIYVNQKLTSVADKRSVLYWGPYLELKPNENAQVKWYNNDDAKNFRVIIIGFDENNDPLYYNEVLK